MDRRELPLTSTHWGTYRVHASNGRVQALYGFEEDGDPSPIGPGVVDVQDGPTRVAQPMIRKSWLEEGPGAKTHLRGAEPFVAVSWEQAEQLVGDELNRVRQTFGNNAIFAGSYGWASAGRFHHAQSQMKRFMNCIGGFTRSVFTYSFAAAETVVPHILGSFRQFLETSTSWDSIIENTELFVAFGGLPLKNAQIGQGGVGKHYQKESMIAGHAAGIEYVNVGPLRSDVLESVGGTWLAARPNTDVAILLGIAHTLISEGLHDEAFLDKYAHGFDVFARYVTGESDGIAKTADWAAEISEIPADTLRDLARRMASSRTMLSVSWSLTRQDHGEQPFWAAIAVAAMLGQIGLPGGGIGFGYSAINSIGGRYTRMQGASVPQGNNPVKDLIPVARISDLLLNPGEPFEFDGTTYTYPDTKVVYWAGGNPFHHHQDINLMLKAWQQPDTVIVNEWCWNSLAKHADIVLPCSIPLERQDIAMTPRDPYTVSMSKVIEPFAASRSDHEIFAGIARHMGVEDAFTEGRTEDEWLKWIYDETRAMSAKEGIDIPAYDDFLKDGWFKLEDPADPIIMMQAFIEDPVKNALDTPSGKIEIFSDTIHGFGYDDCPGHPVWLEPVEWLGQADAKHPLHLISNQPKDKLHSQLDHGSVSRARKITGREPVLLHPDDASARGIADGDVVRVFNDRGACLGGAMIDDHVRPGVIQMSTGAWYDPEEPGKPGSLCKHGNPNVLTIDKGTSQLGQGPIAHSCLVDVELFEGEAPEVTAFEPPEILHSV